MIPYNEDATEKPSLKGAERTNGFNANGPMQKGTGLQQVDGQVHLSDRGQSLVDGQVYLSNTGLSLADGRVYLSQTINNLVDGDIKLPHTGLNLVDEEVKLLYSEFTRRFKKRVWIETAVHVYAI